MVSPEIRYCNLNTCRYYRTIFDISNEMLINLDALTKKAYPRIRQVHLGIIGITHKIVYHREELNYT